MRRRLTSISPFFFALLAACGGSTPPSAAPSVSAAPAPVAPSVASVASAVPVAPVAPVASAPSTPPAAPVASGPCTTLPRKESVTARDGSVVYVEENPAIKDEAPVDVAPRTNLCIVRPGAAPKLLLAGHPADEPSKSLVGMSELVADPGADFVYFSTPAWVTSSAAHAVSLTTGAENFLTDGTVLEVLTKGKYAGKLVMSHFRLDGDYPVSSPKYRGRVEMYSVVDRAGKTVLKLPEDAAARKALLAK